MDSALVRAIWRRLGHDPVPIPAAAEFLNDVLGDAVEKCTQSGGVEQFPVLRRPQQTDQGFLNNVINIRGSEANMMANLKPQFAPERVQFGFGDFHFFRILTDRTCRASGGLYTEVGSAVGMNIESTKLDKAVLVRVSGRMDAENSPQFQQACEGWLAQGETHLAVDLSELTYVSSMGLGCFLAVAKAIQGKAGSMVLVGLHGLPKQVFELTRLIALFPVFESTEEALTSFR